MIFKMLHKVEIVGKFFKLIKALITSHNIVINNKRLTWLPANIKNKAWLPTFTTFIQNCTVGPSQFNKAVRWCKQSKFWQKRSKYLLRLDYITSSLKNFKEPTKQVLELIHEFNKVSKNTRIILQYQIHSYRLAVINWKWNLKYINSSSPQNKILSIQHNKMCPRSLHWKIRIIKKINAKIYCAYGLEDLILLR